MNACCATECSTLSPLTEHGEERLLRPPSLLLKLYRQHMSTADHTASKSDAA